jgi:predicted transcriptional regulator
MRCRDGEYLTGGLFVVILSDDFHEIRQESSFSVTNPAQKVIFLIDG